MKSKEELASQFIDLLKDLMASNVGETPSITAVAQQGMRIFNDEKINKEIQDIMFSQRTIVKTDTSNVSTSRKRIVGGKIIDIDSTVEQIEDVKKKIEPIKSGQQLKGAQTVSEQVNEKVESNPGSDNPSLELITEILNQDTNQISEGLGIENALNLVQLLGHKFEKQPTPLGVIKKLKELLTTISNNGPLEKIQTINDFIKSL